MTRFRRFLALGAMVGAAALAVGATATSAAARGGNVQKGYTMDAYGNLDPMTINSVVSPTVTTSTTWPGWKIARGFAEQQNHTDGLTLDGWGGLHGWGTDTSANKAPANPTDNTYWKGWDIARGVVLLAGSGTAGYVLDGWGGVHPFGGAAAVTVTGYYPGNDIVNAIDLNPPLTNGCTESGFTLDVYGGIHPFYTNDGTCTTAFVTPTLSAYWGGWNIARGLIIDNDEKAGNSGYVLDGWGGLHGWCDGAGCTPPADPTSFTYWQGWDIARGVASTGSGQGYVLDGWGHVHGFGGLADPGTSGFSFGNDIFRDLDES